MSEAPIIQIVSLPKLKNAPENDAKLRQLAVKFRELRLKSLQLAPDAFASSYEVESQRSLDQSLERMGNPKAAQYFALRQSDSTGDSPVHGDDVDRLLRYEWIGGIALLGPEEGSELSTISANMDPFGHMTAISDHRLFEPTQSGALHFHINGMFVDPSCRGGGIGHALMAAALRRAEAEAAKTNSDLRVTLSVFSHNVAARRTYEKAGFKVVSEENSRSKPGRVAVHMELSIAADP